MVQTRLHPDRLIPVGVSFFRGTLKVCFEMSEPKEQIDGSLKKKHTPKSVCSAGLRKAKRSNKAYRSQEQNGPATFSQIPCQQGKYLREQKHLPEETNFDPGSSLQAMSSQLQFA